jgi:hypothetical protein
LRTIGLYKKGCRYKNNKNAKQSETKSYNKYNNRSSEAFDGK